jgi:putative nucleotidyltransferase with HDIG domain
MVSPEDVQKQIRDLRYLPASAELRGAVVDASTDVKTLVRNLRSVVASDPALCAKILQVANSEVYGHPRQIGTLDFALMVIGFDAASEILIGIRLVSSLNRELAAAQCLKGMVRHSVSTALLSENIARATRYPVTGEAFVAGLLHDVGLLVLSQVRRGELERARDITKQTDTSFIAAEERVLGFTHAEVGGWLSDAWGFPARISEAIAFHHTPSGARRYRQLTGIVHLADALSPRLTRGTPLWERAPGPLEEFLGSAGLGDPKVLEEVLSRASAELASRSELESTLAQTEE